MMVTRLARPDAGLPLLTWPEQTEAAVLAEERAALVSRIAKLPRFSHRRVILSAKLAELTERQLRLEGEIAAKRMRQ